MPWNPEIYNQFKNIRYQPFFDLMQMINADSLVTAVDLGCGTGEQTVILAEKFEKAKFLGIDTSTEMLADAEKRQRTSVKFLQGSIEAFADDETKWDLVFSNAALQWSDNHEALFPKLISKLNKGGQFAVQMPVQNENLLNKILLEQVQETTYADHLKNWKRISPVLSIDAYAKIMFDGGLENLVIMQKVYPIIAESPGQLVDFISGSALVPYHEKLSKDQQESFTEEFKRRVDRAFGRFPAIYAFKRLLLYGRRGG